jgi:hypothetical protein
MIPDFQTLVPEFNLIQPISPGGLWRVCYHNEGKMRISQELVAFYESKNQLVHMVDGQVFDVQAFNAYRRQRWPLAHEKERNPENVTLGVHSGSSPNRAKL